MQTQFLGQPFGGGTQLGTAVLEAMEAMPGGSLLAITAWAKASGLRRLKEPFKEYRASRGTAHVLLGIDAAGATWEGLEHALELFDEVRVFHDPGSRTFHPKVYIVRGPGDPPSEAFIAVGSSNMTKGGLFENYEASLAVHLDPSTEEGGRLLESAIGYYQSFLDAGDACKVLTPEVLEQWRDDPPVPIESERGRVAGRQRTEAPSDSGNNFGSPLKGLMSAPLLPTTGGVEATAADPDEDDSDDFGPIPEDAPVTTVAGEPAVVRRWRKQMARTDAQQAAPGSNPTGNLRLTAARNPIDWRTFFRRDLFADVDWRAQEDRRGNRTEVASVEFDVSIRGVSLGTRTLTVDHAPHRQSNQDNHVTVLHWGELSETLRATSYVDDYVVLERLEDGRYRLRITEADPGAVT